jgi:hypothetical protein
MSGHSHWHQSVSRLARSGPRPGRTLERRSSLCTDEGVLVYYALCLLLDLEASVTASLSCQGLRATELELNLKEASFDGTNVDRGCPRRRAASSWPVKGGRGDSECFC